MARVSLLSKAQVAGILPPRDPRSHKGQNGRVLVLGGSKEYCGSPALVSLAALRAGADLSYLLAPEFIAPTLAGYAPDLIVWSYPGYYLSEHAFSLLSELEKKVDVLVIGNGLTKHSNVLRMVRQILKTWEKSVIVDADAIIPGLEFASEKIVFTPHVVEFERLGGPKPSSSTPQRCKQVAELAASLGAVVLLKGVEDVASDGSTVLTNKTGNAGMTVGGTGDTLAGICAAFLARGVTPLNAAGAASFVNGAAGDLAFKKSGYSFLASELITEIPEVMKSLTRPH